MITFGKLIIPLLVFLLSCSSGPQEKLALNPIIHADVPDMSIIRVGSTYYMASTTMHMSPGLPIMKSEDLVNWELVSYAYDTLADNDMMNLTYGKHAYGRGSWAPCLRFHNGVFYASTFSATSGRTHIFKTLDIEDGPWEEISFAPSLHDHTIFFDDDGKVYLIWGVGRITMVELKDDLSGVKEGTERVLIENASAPAGDSIMLQAEGSQLFKVNGKYFLFNITWPWGGMRTVIIHRADRITGPYESRLALQDRGIAQGGLIDTPEGEWFAYLFRDYGSVGRIPYLVPVTWEDGWPVLGEHGVVPDTLNLPASRGLIPGIVAPDDFQRGEDDPDLPLVWQWNHNPVQGLWSVREREGYLRLKTGSIVGELQQARNTLTQRTFGPVSSATTAIEVENMKEGDFAGLCALQLKYGQVGVKHENGQKRISMVSNQTTTPVEIESVPLEQARVYLKIECDFRDRTDIARFFYSLDGVEWRRIGNPLRMEYTLPLHFMGYRFGLFNYATTKTGGFVDFDYFDITNEITN